MICRLCLKNELSVFDIFADRGAQLNVAQIVARHFWFEPKRDDPISTVICNSCWKKTAEFNEFYAVVEEAHRLLTERFSVKFDSNKQATLTKRQQQQQKSENNGLIDGSELIAEEEETIITVENYESMFDGVLDEKNDVTLEKIEADISLPHLEDDDIAFPGDENDFTEYLSLDESAKSDEDTQTVPILTEEATENRRVTRAGSKLIPVPSSLSNQKLSKRKSQTNKIEVKKRRCGRPRKNSPTNSESFASPAIETDKKVSSPSTIYDKAESRNKSEPNCKFHRIDERISKILSLQCDICGSNEATFAELLKHMHDVHGFERGYATCCGKKFYRRSLLFHHTELHMNPDCFKCLECDKTFADKQCLRNHILIKHQPDEAKIYSCNFCEKKFAKAYLLDQHQRKHEERKHICEMCERGFATPSLLNAHINIIHNNYGTMCEICAKVIRGRSAFAKHVLNHQGVTFPKVQCPKCGAWYKDKNSLQKHIRRHNEEGIIHKCLECGKIAPNRSALLSHKRYVHKERAYECGICNKSFKKQLGLKEHMTVHTGESLYNCPHCPRTFNSNANMHTHRKKKHPKEFAEARLKRHETKTNYLNEEITETQLDQNDPHQLLLGNNDETHIIIPADNFNELVFNVS